ANPYVERISTRGFSELNLHFASTVIRIGQSSADAVAAVPSLHLGGTFLFVLFMWKRLNKWWRPVLVAYPILMTFSLVYSAEHFVADCLAGVLAATLVHLGANRIERWRTAARALDTLDGPQEPPVTQESECPPPRPLPATTPSSI
ncbi:MAG: phosphatase PAP2 family protein, partial [Jatrophihabitans sp.]